MISSDQSARDSAEGSSSRSVVVNTADHHHHHPHPHPHPYPHPFLQQQQQQQQSGGQVAQLSRYESQKRRDWNTFGQYLRNQRPPVALTHCSYNHVLEFLRYLDQFGKTKVHMQGCVFFGQPEPAGPCTCPLRQAWGSLDALIGRLRAAFEENGGIPDNNPFASGAIRVFLREIRDSQAKARGIPYKKKKKQKKRIPIIKPNDQNSNYHMQPS